MTVHGLFSVGSGANTFYFLADEGGGSFTAYDMQLSIMFFPTAYGLVSSTIASPGAPPDEAAQPGAPRSLMEIEAERTESIAANEDRILAELEMMRDRIAELEAALAARVD